MKKNVIIIGLLIVAIIAVFEFKKQKPDYAIPDTSAAASLPRLLELGSVKCVPCKMMAPILDELKETFAGQLHVDFIDVWQQEGAGESYGIRVIPTQIFFDAEGNELFRHEGFFAREDILTKWREMGYRFTEN
jgi:thioredoxin 1